MTLPITILPTEQLRIPSRLVNKSELSSLELQAFMSELIPTMYSAKGIGIAAIQVSIPKNRYEQIVRKTLPATPSVTKEGLKTDLFAVGLQVCVIGKDAIPKTFSVNGEPYHKVKDLILVNPTIDRKTKKYISEEEGCLSVPGISGAVKRFKEIQVTALDEQGRSLSFPATGFFARVIQHEVDHLNGILFVDRSHSLYELEV